MSGAPRMDLASGASGRAGDGIEVVLPVFGAGDDLARCLQSVLAHTDLGRHRLVLVLDGPQDAAVEAALAPLAGLPAERALVLREERRRGFAAACNRGLVQSSRDAVLLNSDTRVTAGWLDKLQAAAASAPEVGTVTPFSNNATICSLPRFLAENTVPAGLDVDGFAALVERAAVPSYPRLPTGVGFCLYVRRELLSRVGLLDAERFGLGYGEETDLCMRASAAGFVHLLDDATYVWHRGRGSFGGATPGRLREAERRMRRRHPGYLRAVADFIRRDPLAAVRERVVEELRAAQAEDRPVGCALRTNPDGGQSPPYAGPRALDPFMTALRTDPDGGQSPPYAGPRALDPFMTALRTDPDGGQSPPYAGPRTVDPFTASLRTDTRSGPHRVVHLVHGWPPWSVAGTEVYAHGLARRQAAHHSVAAFARVAWPGRRTGEAIEHHDHGVRVRLLTNRFDQRDPLARNALDDRRLRRDFARFLAEERPELIHVHHLAGHCATLVAVAAHLRVPIVMQLQDWWAPCARVNLLHRDGYLCPGPSLARCAACAPLTRRAPAALWNRLLHLLRRRWMRAALGRTDLLVCGSRFLAESYRSLGWLPAGREPRVLPYGIETDGLAAAARARGDGAPALPLRCGFVGSLMPHKGAHVAVAAFAGLAPEEATLEVWGDPAADPAYAQRLRALAGPSVRFRGRFAEEEKAQVLGGLDVVLVPSLGLESFGLVAREALAAGAAVLASRRGALAELFDGAGEGPGGALVEPGDADAIAARLRRWAGAPQLLAMGRRGTAPPKSMDEHAAEIEAVYAELLAARSARR